MVTGANGYTGNWLCRYLVGKGIPTRGMYWAPEGVPDFKHDKLELVPGDLRDLKAVRQARPVMVALVRDEHLGLAAQAAKGAGMDDAVPVAFVSIAGLALGLRV
ncbi:MAG: NAD-dependent epimerase/dehydratase family protein [Rhodospirillales bacterium]|nr:NAD-dependent epimerase/dehydratase family protein [Rhodospirillales bacterium]